MTNKQRLSASVDPDLLAAAEAAVAAGRAPNVSSWVNDALRRQVERDRRMQALDEFLRVYEAEHGRITDEEIHAATHRAAARAVVVRGKAPRAVSGRARRRTGAG